MTTTTPQAPATVASLPPDLRAEFDLLTSNAVEILPRDEFAAKLARARAEGRPLRIKYGADPSAPDIHLGHSVPIRKLRQFQDAGHKVVFIIGGYTARIGDPSGKNTSRPRLTKEQVQANAKTYLEQIYHILDNDPAKLEVVDNADWLEPMTVSDVIEIMSKYTVSQMLEREDFHKRFESETPISLHEFIYPLLQGQDSVEVRADLELGGTDQKFNLLVGRELQRQAGHEPQCIMTMPLLVGLDGAHKMSKSLGNYIGVNDAPRDMFGKTMSLPDALMWDWFALAGGATPDEVTAAKKDFETGARHPRDLKDDLARRIVTLFHGPEEAQRQSDDFRTRFSERAFPEETAERVEFPRSEVANLQQLLTKIGAAKSGREAQRLAEQKAINIIEEPAPPTMADLAAAGDPLKLLRAELPPGTYKLKIGKTRFLVLCLS